MALIELAENHAGDDFFHELGQFTLHGLMELETGERGAAREPSEQRISVATATGSAASRR